MTMTSTFEERVFLVTSDNPRIHHSLSRSRLCTLSKVFEDMLSLSIRSPQTTTNGRIELAVSETEWQLRGFVDVIRGVQLDGSPRYDNYWDDLAKLADKYDCPFAACLVREKIWRHIAEGPNQYHQAFYLAIALKDRPLIQRTCTIVDKRLWNDFRVPQAWRDTMMGKITPLVLNELGGPQYDTDLYYQVYSLRVRKIKIFEKLLAISEELVSVASIESTCGICTIDKLLRAWKVSIVSLLQQYDLSRSVEDQLHSQLLSNLSRGCKVHAKQFSEVFGRPVDGVVPKFLELVDSYTV